MAARNEARRILVLSLRARPEAASEIVAALEAAGASRRALDWASLALSDVGTPQAEAALLRRTRAVLAEEPSALLLQHVSRQVRPGADSVAFLDELAFTPGVDAHLRNRAHLALGALVGNGRLPLAVEGQARARLLEALAAAEGTSEQAQALVALGNTRDPSLAPQVSGYLSAESPAVRAQAWRTLIQLGADVRPRALLAAMGRDPQSPGRNMVAQELLPMCSAPDEEDLKLAWSLVQDSPADPVLRGAALGVLGRAAPRSPSTRALLAGWFHQEPIARLKKLIGRFVSAEALRAARPAAPLGG
ncbi:MAG: HEAT repeat domain-containing protein [Alphaproteobacteria bacterium]|nr:HEAT repeat domain-containing protein [Alphaproteobacteria bacterium]